MQKPTNQDSRETQSTREIQSRFTVDEYTIRRIAHALSADRIIEVRQVSEDTYFVVYDYCEQGYCWYVESYVIFQDGGRIIREKNH